MKKLVLHIFMILTFLISPLSSDDLKTSEDFLPIPPKEKPVGDLLLDDENNTNLVVISGIATATGIGATIYNTYKFIESDIMDPENREFQGQIFFTTISIICTVISIWFLRLILAG